MPQNNLIKLVSESGAMYVFDALTNNFYIIECVEDFESLTISDIGHSIDVRENSLDLLNIHKEVTSNAQTLILEITEKCNLRCTYCDTEYAFYDGEELSVNSIIEKCSETGLFTGYVPGFPGAHSQAESIDELTQNL